METNTKIINNAVSAYFLLFISSMFLVVKGNPYLNNNFVKNHTKVALLLHLSFLLYYILFISFWLISWISIFNYWLNHIVMSVLCIWTLWIMLYWIYKAHKWEMITVNDVIPKKWWENLIQISKTKVSDEKEKLTIMLSYIPFIWYLLYWKHYHNTNLININKINLILSLSITLLYIFWHSDLAVILTLIYIIFVVFVNIVMIIKDESIVPDLKNIPWIQEIITFIISAIKYIISYTKDKDFKDYKIILLKEREKIENYENKFSEILSESIDIKHKRLIYVPFVNLIFIKRSDSKYKLHIANSYILTILLIALWITYFSFDLNNKTQLLLLFPFFYWAWYINRLWYKMPIIYEIYSSYKSIISFIKNTYNKIMKIKKTEKSVNLKVKD